ncbi:hypothetical protein BDZ97DRAFT_703814 [Flammula alnicola]|nr:hypothetical protein BDZ97DRAFT_703814 [Flammula alnicola]
MSQRGEYTKVYCCFLMVYSIWSRGTESRRQFWPFWCRPFICSSPQCLHPRVPDSENPMNTSKTTIPRYPVRLCKKLDNPRHFQWEIYRRMLSTNGFIEYSSCLFAYAWVKGPQEIHR